MSHKKSLLLFVMLMLILTPANLVFAQKPEPPQLNLDAPEIDMQNLPVTVQKAATLQSSLTRAQKAAAREILDGYIPEIEAIRAAMMPVAYERGASLMQKVDPEVTARLRTLLKEIDAELSEVLDAEEMALYRATVVPDLSAEEPASIDFEREPDKNLIEPAGEGSYCDIGAYYDAYTHVYGYIGYIYALYDYAYGSGSDYAYYSYYYAYYGYYYAVTASRYSAPTAYSYDYFGTWTNEEGTPFPYYAYVYAYTAWDYFYYAWVYAYYSYYYYGWDYAYYAYAYNYTAYDGAYYGYNYDYYCYYYYTQ